ncbi:MAG: cysteine hydrolase family protein [Chloroflexota bacterium]
MQLPNNTVLLLIDVQKGFDDPSWGRRNNPQAEEQIVHLLELWRTTRRPVIHVQHMSTEPDSPLRPGQPGNAFKPFARPQSDERIIQKQVNSAFIGTNLEEQLHQNGWDTLVIVGLTTNHCVSTTTRMAGNLGFTTYVVADATATFDRTGPDGQYYRAEDIHNISLASLHNEFATVVDTATVQSAVEEHAI